ncbi:MAG TPA: hypothetical protein VF234_00235, partial [Limnochordia bacterium]
MSVPAEEELVFDRYGAGEVPPHLYDYREIAQGLSGFDAITPEAVARFREEGFLVVHDAFTAAQVAAALDALADLVAGKNPDFKGVQFEAAARDLV